MLRTNLRKAIKDSGLYVKEVAAKAEVPKRTVDKWLELDDINPRAMDLYRVARVLGKTVEELLSGQAVEGVPVEALDLARKIAALPLGDREELEAVIDIKLSRAGRSRAANAAFSGFRKRA
jgi:transcriptional regulator with XRE-family HTH domain